MHQFNKINGEPIDYLRYTKDIVKNFPSVEIHVGTDSYLLNDNTRYITAIAFRFNKAGVHYIYTKKKFTRIKDNWERLWRETELSVDIARQLEKQKVIKKRQIKISKSWHVKFVSLNLQENAF